MMIPKLRVPSPIRPRPIHVSGKDRLLRALLTPLLAAILAAPAALASGQQSPIALPPVSDWKVVTQPGDKVTLSEQNGVLQADFELAIDKARRVGHVTQQEGTFTLELKNPIVLPEDQVRLYFEARMPEAKAETLFIHPLIEDAKGERIAYEPLPERAAVVSKNGGWASWRTHIFNMTEAGGAAKGIYEAEGGDQNFWPDGPVRFVGFVVRVYADKGRRTVGQKSGQLMIGQVSSGGAQVHDVPFAYADAFLSKKGDYKLALETRAAFQGVPIREDVETISYDPASESSRKRRITLPLQQLNNSWVRYRASDAAGAVASEGEFRWELNVRPTDGKELAAVDLAKPPVIGLTRVNPERTKSPREVGGVYKAADPFEVSVRVFPTEGVKLDGWKLKWVLKPYAFDAVLSEGTVDLKNGTGGFADVPIKLERDPSRDAYKLFYTLTNAEGAVVDSGDYTLGFAPDQVAAYGSRVGKMRDRKDIKKFPYFRTTFIAAMKGRAESEQVTADRFKTMLEESKQVADHVTYMIDLADLEILPGVYDFRLLDEAMDVANDNGCGITVRLAHAEGESAYRWLPYTTPRSFDGTALVGHGFYGSYSLTDKDFVASWQRAFRAVHDRYAKHPAFEGYYVMHAGGEWAVPDEPWNGYIADYSWAAEDAFRAYLRDTLKLDLAALNARWKKDYKSWDEVMIPQPDLAAGVAPDLRPEWMDFNRCKQYWKSGWFYNISKEIRSYDPNRIIIVYGSRESDDLLSGLVDYFHNGGNHFLEQEGMLVDSWEKHDIGWITEPHHPHRWAAYGDPADRGWVLDWSVFVMTAQAGAGGANLHVYYMPNPTFSLTAHYGREFALDRFEMFKPILRELHGIQLIDVPKQVAVIQDPDTLFSKHRTTFMGRTNDLRRWFETLKQDSVDFEFYQPKNELNYKMLVLNPLDEVLSQSTIDNAVRMAKNGSWVVMSARSGRYSTEGSGEEYPLLRALGIKPPTGQYVLNEADVTAAVKSNGILGQDRKAMPFFTQADMNKDLQDPKIGGKFFQWRYRWIPQSDYFGYYANNKDVGGEVLARFPDGGVAVSLHEVGKGKALVFWGTPDMNPENTDGLMSAIATKAGVTNPRAGSPIPLILEAKRDDLNRRYVFLYQETAGDYVQKLPNLPDGAWFVDDMVSGSRFGNVEGKAAREQGMKVSFDSAASPLKILRFIPKADMKTRWVEKFDVPEKAENQ